MATKKASLNLERGKPFVPIVLINPDDDYEVYPTYALIDTGADRSIIPEGIAKELMHDNDGKGVETDEICGVCSSAKVYKHTFVIEVLNPDNPSESLFRTDPMLISVLEFPKGNQPKTGEVILGMPDFILKYIRNIDFENGTLTFGY